MASAKQEKMFTLVEKKADQSVKDFCAANNIGEASYYYWQKKFRTGSDTSGLAERSFPYRYRRLPPGRPWQLFSYPQAV
jgi:hypothetical protein